MRIAPPRAVAIELKVGAGFSKLLGNLACILRHPHTHDAKIGSLHTLLPDLRPLIDAGVRPSPDRQRIEEVRGLTVSPAGPQTKCLAILVAPVGPREPARLERLTAFLMSKPAPTARGGAILKTTPVLG